MGRDYHFPIFFSGAVYLLIAIFIGLTMRAQTYDFLAFSMSAWYHTELEWPARYGSVGYVFFAF